MKAPLPLLRFSRNESLITKSISDQLFSNYSGYFTNFQKKNCPLKVKVSVVLCLLVSKNLNRQIRITKKNIHSKFEQRTNTEKAKKKNNTKIKIPITYHKYIYLGKQLGVFYKLSEALVDQKNTPFLSHKGTKIYWPKVIIHIFLGMHATYFCHVLQHVISR